MDISAPTRDTHRVPQARLWFGACAGAAAWALHGFVSFLISAEACSNGRGTLGPLSAPAVRVLLGCVTLLFLTIAVCGGFASFSNWRRVAGRQRLLHDEAAGREEFMSLVGVFVGVAFVVGIIWAGIPPILIDVCINAR